MLPRLARQSGERSRNLGSGPVERHLAQAPPSWVSLLPLQAARHQDHRACAWSRAAFGPVHSSRAAVARGRELPSDISGTPFSPSTFTNSTARLLFRGIFCLSLVVPDHYTRGATRHGSTVPDHSRLEPVQLALSLLSGLTQAAHSVPIADGRCGVSLPTHTWDKRGLSLNRARETRTR